VLDDHGIAGGDVVAVLGDFHPTSCAVLLALIDRGCVIVPLTTATAPQHDELLELSEAQHLLVITEDDWSIRPLDREVSHPLLRDVIDRGVPGLVVFSSGSTGKSKGMVHDLSRTLEKFVTPRAPLVTISFLLFDHLGGLNTLLHTLSNNGTVVATRSREPDAVCELVERHGVELLPVSPTFLGLMLLSGAHRRHDMSSLRLVTYGTEMMPQSTLDSARRELPDVEFRQTYGLSETGVLRTKSRDDGSLWLKVGGEGIETKVVDGTLWVRSRWAITGYLNAPDPFDADGWLNTQDRVETDGDYIRFLGRETDIINVGGNKVYPAEVESVLLELDNVGDAVVYGEANRLTGHVVAARLVLEHDEPHAELVKRVRKHVLERLERFKVPARVEIADEAAVSARFKKVRPAASRSGEA
jgi:acyl-coenzyme A synthetase/AMP-(fatty) acid ligase